MTVGPVPCWSCGRPIQPGSLTCPACGVFADIAAPEGQTAATTDRTSPSIGNGQAVDGPASGGIVPPFKLPGSYLSPSAVHQGADPVARAAGSQASGVPAPPAMPAAGAMPLAGTPEPAPVAGAMPLAGTPEPAPAGTGMAAGDAGFARPMPASSMAIASAPRLGNGSEPGLGVASAAARPGQAPLFADLPFDAPNSLSGWLVMIGSAVAAISFLLPWAPGIVNYTSSWGLSSLANLPILAILVAIVILAILPNGVPLWIRSAVLPLIGGSLFLGLLWPYVLGDFGAVFGSIVGAAGAVVLIVGGIVAVAPRAGKQPAA